MQIIFLTQQSLNLKAESKIVLTSRIGNFKKKIIEGRGFRGGLDEKMRRMWLGREIVVAGLPPLGEQLFQGFELHY